MSGIFPAAADGGVVPEAATNGYDPVIPPAEGAALYYGNGCGVVLRPEVLNSLISEIACLSDKAQRPYDSGNLCNVYESIMALINASQRGMPIYPEIISVSNKMTINGGAGLVNVPDGQVWRHRGFRDLNSTDIPAPQRSFATIASSVYHLRWYAPGILAPVSSAPSGVIAMHILTDPVYNPGVLAETDQSFDSNYDSMLMARVTTNAGNVATVVPLLNQATRRQFFTKASKESGTSWGVLPALTAVLDWARTPDLSLQQWSVDVSTGAEATCNFDTTVTRYNLTAKMTGYNLDPGSVPNTFISGSLTVALKMS